MSHVLAAVADITKQLEELKEEFLNAITDKEHTSLEERWDAFSQAPSDLVTSSSSSCLASEQEVAKLLDTSEICFYDDLYIERYQIVDEVFILEETIYEKWVEKEGKEYNSDISRKEYLELESVKQAKEAILDSGTRYFQFDW